MAKLKVSIKTKIGNIDMKNPVVVASGTYEYNEVTKGLIDIKEFGAIVTKTVTLKPKKGNPPPRTCETSSGMLNAIGLQNKGIELFLKEDLPTLKKIGIPIIVSIAGSSEQEFEDIAGKIESVQGVSAIELNLSCPNLGHAKLFAQDSELTYNTVSRIKRTSTKTVIAKLTPNVTDISEIAKAAQDARADAVSLINTLSAMAIDIETRKPRLGNVTGGLSGPAIKPVALKMIWQVASSLNIPVIGMGGVFSTSDAIEFMIAGASAVAIGTGNFVNPSLGVEIIDGIKDYMARHKINKVESLVGSLKREG